MVKKLNNARWFVLGVVVSLVISAFALPTVASSMTKTAELTYRDIKITLNGESLNPKDATGNDVEPFIIDGTTYLPVRAVADALGLNVSWDSDTSTAVLSGSTSSGGATDYERATSAAMKIYHDLQDISSTANVSVANLYGLIMSIISADGDPYYASNYIETCTIINSNADTTRSFAEDIREYVLSLKGDTYYYLFSDALTISNNLIAASNLLNEGSSSCLEMISNATSDMVYSAFDAYESAWDLSMDAFSKSSARFFEYFLIIDEYFYD